MERTFLKTGYLSGHVKRCFILLFIKEMKIKSPMRSYKHYQKEQTIVLVRNKNK